MSLKRIIVLDDHPLYLSGLKSVLNDNQNYIVVGCCKNVSGLLYALTVCHIDIIIMSESQTLYDLPLDRFNRVIGDNYPDIKIVVLNGDHESPLFMPHHKLDAAARIDKTMKADAVLSILDTLRIIPKKDTTFKTRLHEKHPNEEFPALSVLTQKFKLSRSEQAVIKYIQQGMRVSQISALMGKSPKTISAQKRNAYRKMKVDSDAQFFIHYKTR